MTPKTKETILALIGLLLDGAEPSEVCLPAEASPAAPQPSGRPKVKKSFYGKIRRYADQEGAFVSAVETTTLVEDITWETWLLISGIYGGLRAKTPEAELTALWQASKSYRLGETKRATPLVKALARYDLLKTEQRKIWARETGYNADRERKRKAQDPDAYRAANAERQRRSRARRKSQAKPKAPTLTLVETSHDDRDEKAARK